MNPFLRPSQLLIAAALACSVGWTQAATISVQPGDDIAAAIAKAAAGDVIEIARAQYRTNLQDVKRVDILGRHRIRFVFKQANNPLLILHLGELPVLPQHYWKHRDFKATTYTPPLGSGPYRISQVEPGRSLTFERVKNW